MEFIGNILGYGLVWIVTYLAAVKHLKMMVDDAIVLAGSVVVMVSLAQIASLLKGEKR